ncbi:FxLYD domain-containing protein [Acaryochloris sp. IP29b_bin.137]|uniref:FxLYD domain-containing protein n=1 Tax=Acaryochloris sp. IP29b_bin.137 TaxID=2969217 RepID=UPI0026264FEA|nr:FxLYD domain-containing protein [Acaryochloris sp. IP29b_bin.137]
MNSNSPILAIKILLSAIAILPIAVPTTTNAAEDIVIIGETAAQKQRFQTYWQQLLNLNQAAERAKPKPQAQSLQAAREKKLEKITHNLYVEDIGLDYIIQLNGSSQLSGILTNRNDIPVTVLAVNYEILDRSGYLLQTGSAQPKPSTIAPGQSVTFADTLWTIDPDEGYEVRLLDPPFQVSLDSE